MNLSGRTGGISYISQTKSLNTTSMMALRQQMDKSNLEFMNNMTQQMSIIKKPMVDLISRMLETFGLQPV